jgi:hypothetical protein
MIRNRETLHQCEHLIFENQLGVSQALLADGGLTTSRPTLLDPLGPWPKTECCRPTRESFRTASQRRRVHGLLNYCPLWEVKLLNSKRPENRVHRQDTKNPYDRHI